GEDGPDHTVDTAALRLGQQPQADRLPNPVADAAADGAQDDQDQHRAQRPDTRAGEVDGMHQHRRQGGPDHHPEHETGVLRQREPEAAPVSAADGEHDGDQDNDVDEREARHACTRRLLRGFPTQIKAYPSASSSLLISQASDWSMMTSTFT